MIVKPNFINLDIITAFLYWINYCYVIDTITEYKMICVNDIMISVKYYLT